MKKASRPAPNLTSLTTALAQKKEEDRQQIEALTSTVLQKLEANLQTQSADVLTSTGTVIQRKAHELAGDVAGAFNQAQQSAQTLSQQLQEALAQQGEALKTELAKQSQLLQEATQRIGDQKTTLASEITQTRRLLKWLQWIWLGSLIVCLMGFAGVWAYWKLANPYETLTAADGRQWQAMKGSNWQMCQGNRPCRPYGTQ